MSLSSILGKERSQPNPAPAQNITQALNRFVDSRNRPFIFIQSNQNALSSNVADGVLIIQSPVMRHGERGLVKDLNVNFTTVAGTVRIVKVQGYTGQILVDVIRGINASSSGTGDTVLEEGEAIAILGQSAGAGIFSVFFSGSVTRIEV